MKRITIATAMLSALLAGPTLALAQQHDIEHLVVEMANTPEEHRAVAQHFTMRAEEARAEARRHEQMGRIYAGSRNAQPQRGRQHCENLAEKFQEIAAEFEELAKLHEDQARSQ